MTNTSSFTISVTRDLAGSLATRFPTKLIPDARNAAMPTRYTPSNAVSSAGCLTSNGNGATRRVSTQAKNEKPMPMIPSTRRGSLRSKCSRA